MIGHLKRKPLQAAIALRAPREQRRICALRREHAIDFAHRVGAGAPRRVQTEPHRADDGAAQQPRLDVTPRITFTPRTSALS